MSKKMMGNKFIFVMLILIVALSFVPLKVSGNNADCNQYCQQCYGTSGQCSGDCKATNLCFAGSQDKCGFLEGVCCCSGPKVQADACGGCTNTFPDSNGACDVFCQSHYGTTGQCRVSCDGGNFCFPNTQDKCDYGVCCCVGVPHIEGTNCGAYTVPPYSCDGKIDKTTGKCAEVCGADHNCDGKDPSSVRAFTDTQCAWCDADCSAEIDNNKPCDTAVCDVGGWDDSSCSGSGTHKACQGNSCVYVNGAGSDECTTDSNCGGGGGGGGDDTHKACQGTSCVDVPGTGLDQCTTDSECSNPPPVSTHSACQGTSCVEVSGEGANQCYQDLDCCNDGDCAASKCSGSWKPGAPSIDLSQSGNYCCGDDGSGDLGPPQGDYLCVLDDGYQWIKGSEDQTYLNNGLFFCDGLFHFCIDNPGYTGVNIATACENDCDFYCELNTKKWVDRRTSPYLSEPLIPDEPVDQIKNNMQGSNGCCPAMWCWNGTICEENQIDEACDKYEYNLSHITYRCKDGEWSASKRARDWSNQFFGYCPSNSDCFISCDSCDNNYNPDTYFSDEKPQCIQNGQYILDNYCYNRSWITRTSLMATKLVNSMETESHDNFEIYCGDYKSVVNEYNYLIDSTVAEEFLLKNCQINGEFVPCTNNFCLIKNLENNQMIFGTSLNNNLSSGDYAFSKVIDLSSCSGSLPDSVVSEWNYLYCNDNIFYNPEMKIILYSDSNINLVESMNGWKLFKHFLSHPFTTIISLIKGNQIYYENKVTNTKLKFPTLNHAPAYGKLFLMDNGAINISGILEFNKFDPATKTKGDYMMITYTGVPNVCLKIDDATSFSNETKCVEDNGESIVTDASNFPYLRTKWLDLTTKLIRQ